MVGIAEDTEQFHTDPDISIRILSEEDLPEAVRIEQTCIMDPWSERVYREEFSHQGDYIWLSGAFLLPGADDEACEHMAGTISLTRMGDDGEIGNVAVLPEYRRRGIAEQMLRQVLYYGQQKLGMRNFTLEVRNGNRPAIALYEKCGFRAEGIRPHMYRNPEEDARIMWLRNDV